MVRIKDIHPIKRRKLRNEKNKLMAPGQYGWTSVAPWISRSTHNFQLNKYIRKAVNISVLKSYLGTKGIWTLGDVTIRHEPFQIGIVEDFISKKEKLSFLYKEIELLKWNTKKMDLYELYQSPDLSNITSPYLSNFYKFLKTDVLKWMSEITGFKFTKVSATCSMYNATNYLLPHDDLLEDRLVAFVFYICPWKLHGEYSKNIVEAGWSSKMGGNFKLFTVNKYNEPVYPAVDKISPKNNRFIFFKVNEISYHEVEEVYTSDYSRLSINGWFHGPKKISSEKKICNESPTKILFNLKERSFLLEGLVDPTYLTKQTTKAINAQIEENSEISLAQFFNKNIYDSMFQKLASNSVQWKRVGPVSKCNYEVAYIEILYEFLYSDSFISLLRSYTDLNLPIKDFQLKKSLIEVQVQRWTAGCYTVIHDKSEYDCDELDVILYFNCTENSTIGAITYLDPGDTEDNVLLTIYPRNNFLNIVYRTSGTTRFTKYVNHKMMDSSKYFYIISCKYKEINE